jgi:hypothetical protein
MRFLIRIAEVAVLCTIAYYALTRHGVALGTAAGQTVHGGLASLDAFLGQL